MLPIAFFALITSRFLHACYADADTISAGKDCAPAVTTVFCTTTQMCTGTITVYQNVKVTVTSTRTVLEVTCPPIKSNPPIIEVFCTEIPRLCGPAVEEIIPVETVTCTATTTVAVSKTISLKDSVTLTVTNTKTSLRVLCPTSSTCPKEDVNCRTLTGVQASPTLRACRGCVGAKRQQSRKRPCLLSGGNCPCARQGMDCKCARQGMDCKCVRQGANNQCCK